MARVEYVAGEATVVLIIGNKPIEPPLRDKLIDAREALLAEVKDLTDQIDGRKLFGRTIPQLKARRKGTA